LGVPRQAKQAARTYQAHHHIHIFWAMKMETQKLVMVKADCLITTILPGSLITTHSSHVADTRQDKAQEKACNLHNCFLLQEGGGV
jgi:hypothetical protein